MNLYTRYQAEEHRKDILAEFILAERPMTSADIQKQLPELGARTIGLMAAHLAKVGLLDTVVKADPMNGAPRSIWVANGATFAEVASW